MLLITRVANKSHIISGKAFDDFEVSDAMEYFAVSVKDMRENNRYFRIFISSTLSNKTLVSVDPVSVNHCKYVLVQSPFDVTAGADMIMFDETVTSEFIKKACGLFSNKFLSLIAPEFAAQTKKIEFYDIENGGAFIASAKRT